MVLLQDQNFEIRSLENQLRIAEGQLSTVRAASARGVTRETNVFNKFCSRAGGKGTDCAFFKTISKLPTQRELEDKVNELKLNIQSLIKLQDIDMNTPEPPLQPVNDIIVEETNDNVKAMTEPKSNNNLLLAALALSLVVL